MTPNLAAGFSEFDMWRNEETTFIFSPFPKPSVMDANPISQRY